MQRELGTVKKTLLMHGTEGYKSLETAVKSLHAIVSGCGPNFRPLCTPQFLDVVFRCLNHSNRFVRENGFYLCAAICDMAENKELAEVIGPMMAPKLTAGLLDEWNQVVRAASMAVRSFMTHLEDHQMESFWKQMLPSMCFHRHNPADGIKLYSQDTWKQVLKTKGRSLIAKCARAIVRSSELVTHSVLSLDIDDMVEYYAQQGANDDNTPLKEAACYAVGELATKVNASAVKPHVPVLLNTLLHNLEHQNTWSVIDAACLSATDLLQMFPGECRAELPHLIELLSENISHGST